MIKKIITLTFFLFPFFAQFSSAQNRTSQLDSLFNSLVNTGKFNGNVLIAEKGKPIYQRSFGYANEGSGTGYANWFERHLTNDKTIIILQNHDWDNVVIPTEQIRKILYKK